MRTRWHGSAPPPGCQARPARHRPPARHLGTSALSPLPGAPVRLGGAVLCPPAGPFRYRQAEVPPALLARLDAELLGGPAGLLGRCLRSAFKSWRTVEGFSVWGDRHTYVIDECGRVHPSYGVALHPAGGPRARHPRTSTPRWPRPSTARPPAPSGTSASRAPSLPTPTASRSSTPQASPVTSGPASLCGAAALDAGRRTCGAARRRDHGPGAGTPAVSGLGGGGASGPVVLRERGRRSGSCPRCLRPARGEPRRWEPASGKKDQQDRGDLGQALHPGLLGADRLHQQHRHAPRGRRPTAARRA